MLLLLVQHLLHYLKIQLSLHFLLQPYEYEGQPAYGIFANGQQLGSVPKDMVSIIEENYSRILDFSNIEVYGGGRDENMNTKNYGCEVTLRLKKN